MEITIAELTSQLKQAAEKIVPPDAAQYFADEVVETHLRKMNRSNPLKSALGDIEACLKHKDKKLNYAVNLPAYFSIDFQSHGPLPYLKEIHDELEARASKCGLSMVSFVNSKSMHTLHNWVQGIAKRGLLAIAVCNGGPAAVVPHNGTKGLFGTNPLAYGIPGDAGAFYCIDMATSEEPYFEILNAKAENRPLKEGTAVDSNGTPTTDASSALDYSKSATDPISNLLPMGGGYKGYNLIYLLEIMTGGMIGSKTSPEMSADYVAEEHGSFIIVIDPKALGTADHLAQSVKTVNATLSEQKPKREHEIAAPGARNNERYKACLRAGSVDIEEELLTRLCNLQ